MAKIIVDSQLRDSFFYNRNEEGKIPVCPLMLAVTGHRKMEESCVSIVRKRTASFFIKTGNAWRSYQKVKDKNMTPAPILVLCGMAIGADSMVAEEIIKLKANRPELNFKLVAVLPMPEAIYEEDFKIGAERDNFRRLLNEADYRIELPLIQKNQDWLCKHAGESLSADHRTAQYVELGKFLTANSLYLLALCNEIKDDAWYDTKSNDVSTRGTQEHNGGSEDVVCMKLKGIASESAFPIRLSGLQTKVGFGAAQPLGSVFQIVTPKVGTSPVHDKKNCAPGDLWVYTACTAVDDKADTKRSTPFQRRKILNLARFFVPLRLWETRLSKRVVSPFMESAIFNRDSCRLYGRFTDKQLESKMDLLGTDLSCISDDTQFMAEYYSLADNMAIHFQSKFFWRAFIYLLLVLGFSFVFYLECYCRPWHTAIERSSLYIPVRVLDFVYFGFFAGFLIIFLYNYFRADYERYHRYRALAEVLRVQIFWHLAGIDEEAFNHYWSHQIENLNWLRITAKNISMTTRPSGKTHFDLVKNRWIDVQLKYFLVAAKGLKDSDGFWSNCGVVFTYFTLIWFVLRIFVTRFADRFVDPIVELTPESARILFYFGIPLLAMAGVAALCCFVWNRLKSNGSLAKRYSKIIPIYQQSITAIEEVDEDVRLGQMQPEIAEDNRRIILRYLGESALAENADWFLMTRKLDLPR